MKQPSADGEVPKPENAVRFATFNASLNRAKAGALIHDLSTRNDPQAANVAEIIQRVRPDVLLINEFDYDQEGKGGPVPIDPRHGNDSPVRMAKASQAAELFQKNYLGVAHNGAEPIVYPNRYTPPVNTGVASGVDLDNDGKAVTTPGSRGYGNDAIGFGQFPGQYGMTVYSMYPIRARHTNQPVSTPTTGSKVYPFGQGIRWDHMPGALLPTKPDGSPWYSPEALEALPLSSKTHCDVSVDIGSKLVHLLVSHPTPPAFDGPERRNARRNHDEIRLWADYISGLPSSAYLFGPAAPKPPETFVIMGDLNADPVDGSGIPGAIDQLLKHPKVNAANPPRSEGAIEASKKQGQANAAHKGDPAFDTADFADEGPGNLRADYVLPSTDLTALGSGVFWPAEVDPLSRLVKMSPTVASSDHRLVYVDIKKP